jgi:hypothetical protein
LYESKWWFIHCFNVIVLWIVGWLTSKLLTFILQWPTFIKILGFYLKAKKRWYISYYSHKSSLYLKYIVLLVQSIHRFCRWLISVKKTWLYRGTPLLSSAIKATLYTLILFYVLLSTINFFIYVCHQMPISHHGIPHSHTHDIDGCSIQRCVYPKIICNYMWYNDTKINFCFDQFWEEVQS